MIQAKVPKASRRQPREVEIDIHVGGRIHERRKLLGLSQADLSLGLGVTFQQLQKYETGANRISAGKLYQCAQLLNTNIEFFFDGLPSTSTKKKTGKKAAEDKLLQADETLKLVRGYYLMNADIREHVRDLIDAAGG